MTERDNESPHEPRFSRRALMTGALLGGGAIAAAFSMPWLIEREPPAPEFETQASWQQDFLHSSRTTPDTSTWRYDTDPDVPGYNEERQGYTTDSRNVRIEPGVGLVIEAHREKYAYPDDEKKRTFEYTSGKIDTLNSFNFEYGKVEAKIKVPHGKGVWPAFWMLSANEIHTANSGVSHDGQDNPRYYMKNGEIDIMEFYGQRPGQFEATVHTFDKSSYDVIKVPNISDDFHTYGMELSPNLITWTIDGKPCYRFKKTSNNSDAWPFSGGNKMYVILNLAMGGTGGGAVEQQADSWRMEVQNVSFYKMKPTPRY